METKTKNNYFDYNYGFIIFSILGVLSIPLSLYLFNAKEFLYDYVLIFPSVILVAVTLIIGLIFTILGRLFLNKFNILNRYIQNIFAGLGITIYLNDLIVPTQASALNGDVTNIPEPLLLSLIELIIFAIVAGYLIINFRKTKALNNLVWLSKLTIMLLVFFSFGMCYIQYFDRDETNNPDQNNSIKLNGNSKKSPNVYLLWLDAMQSDFYAKAMVENKLKKSFGGFTLFKHNISNYVYTLPSYHSFLSGLIYDGVDYKKWTNDDKLRKAFVENNYNLTSYGMSLYISKLDNYNMISEQILKQALNIRHPYITDFTSLSLVRLSPNFLANEALALGEKISKKINPYFNPKQVRNINTIEAGMHQYVAPLTYKKMIEDEKLRNPYGEFVLSQILIPHGPEVMDDNCKYQLPIKKLRGEMMKKRFYMQVNCAIKLVDSFLNELKKMDRYDNSLIIIMGDHGAGFAHLLEDKYRKLGIRKKLNENYSGWNEVSLVRRASALLMIKPPGSNKMQELIMSDKESQHIDILPTVFNALGWNIKGEYDGRDLFSDNDTPRNTLLTYFHPQFTPNFNDAEVYHVDYDSLTGRKRLKLINTFNEYFADNNHPLTKWESFENTRKLNKVKKENKVTTKKKLPDSIFKKNFEE